MAFDKSALSLNKTTKIVTKKRNEYEPLMARFIFITLMVLLSCSKTDRPIEIDAKNTVEKKWDTLNVKGNAVDNYSAAIIYTDTDSDSLLLDNQDFDNLIPLYRTKGKLIKVETYGGGDCEGKYKEFDLNGERLTINKSSCGDYGFSNSQFLMRGDSLLRARKYDVQWNVVNKEFELDIIEQIFLFNVGRLTLKERKKSVNDWIGFDLKDIPFKSSLIDGNKEYANLKKELAELPTYELLDD